MLLLLKVTLVPALVGCVTIASRWWGLRIGGILTGLPMVAGPTLCFYAVEQGHAFAAAAARTALLGIAATAGFCVAYARTAARAPWAVSVGAGWIAFAGVAALLYPLPDLWRIGELAIAASALLAGARLIPLPTSAAPARMPPRWDLPLRMTTAAGAVVLFTGVAALLGPRLSGIMSAFPIVTMVLAVFTHAQRGPEPVATFLRALLRGLYGFAVLCVVLSTALGALGWTLLPAFSVALAAQLAVQAFLLSAALPER